MLFSSREFIFLFLPLVFFGFLLLPANPRWLRKMWLLVASVFFYGCWKIEFVPLLLFSIGFNYASAEIISRRGQGRGAKAILAAGVGLNLLLLGFFKYTNFLVDVAFHLARHEPVRFNIILPLAISFFTFTQIGYLVDVYRNRSLHYGFLDYALFVVLFPHLIAGPIVRHWEIIPQYEKKELKPLASDVQIGLALFFIGLFKKIFLADAVSSYVSQVYAGAGIANLTWFDSWLGTLAFAFQIYFDFSGYSDMAIGLARIFGIKFPINFNSPYQATSIAEFWKRWHITLTRFLREYVYFPLGGNRCGPLRHMVNLMITMLLSGLWHGAGLTFVIWGGLHGIYLVIAHRWGILLKRRGLEFNQWWYRFLTGALTFIVVLFAWVFFRAQSLGDSLRVLATMLGQRGLTMSEKVADPLKTAGWIWSHLGARFVPAQLDVEYSSLLKLIAVMFVIAVLLPNSQRLLSAYEPALEPAERPRRLRLSLGLGTGCLFGIGFFFAIRTFYTGAPSPFIYFNF